MSSMVCNIDSGVCEVNLDIDLSNYVYKAPVVKDRVLVEYFTDPLCSACFVFDPTLEELKELYEGKIDFRSIMGGMMPKNRFFGEEAEAMALNIERMGESFNMPMSGKLMRENPVDSSYPPSLAFLSVKKQDSKKADTFLRRLREAVYIEDRDISKEAVLLDLVSELDIDEEMFMSDFYSSEILAELEDNIAYTINNGISGFPSVVVYGLDGKSMILRGVNNINAFKDLLSKFSLEPNEKKVYNIDNVLTSKHFLSTREIYDKLNLYFDDSVEEALIANDDVIKVKVNNAYYFRKA